MPAGSLTALRRRSRDQLAGQARGGAEFMELVKKHDQGDSSYRNGEGEGHRRGEIRPPELRPFCSSRDGDIGPVFESRERFTTSFAS